MTIQHRSINTSSLASLALILAAVLTACPGPSPVDTLQLCQAKNDKITVPVEGIGVEGGDFQTASAGVERRTLSGSPCSLRSTSSNTFGEYALNLAQASDFDLTFSINANNGAKLRLELDGNPLDNTALDVTATGNSYKNFSVPMLTLPSGEHKLRVLIDDLNGSSAVMIEGFKLAKPSKNLPYSSNLPNVPFTLEAEHFDRGGSVLAYLDNTPGNSGAGSRISNVDIDVQGNDQFVTDTQQGEYLKYSFNVPASLDKKYFKVSVRYASSVAGGKFSLGLGGRKLFDKTTVQSSGGNTSWRTENVVVPIQVGFNEFVLSFDSQSGSAPTMNVDRIELSVDSDVVIDNPPPSPPGVIGEVSQIYDWGNHMPIHAALMPNGKVLAWGGGNQNNAGVNYSTFDPMQGQTVPSLKFYRPTNLFCAGFSHLPDGRLLIAGGHWDNFQGVPDANIFDSKNQSMTPTSSMYNEKLPNPVGNPIGDPSFDPDLYYKKPEHVGRWYPSTTPLANGEIMVSEGYSSKLNVVNNLPEVWQTNNGGGWRALTNAQVTDPGALSYYPFQYPRPNGEVVRVGPEAGVYAFSTNGSGAVRKLNNRPDGFNRDYGSAVMFAPGRILLVGGNGGDGSNRFPSNSGVVIDIRNDQPTYTNTLPMRYGRRHLSTTVLPTGDVLISGGSSGRSGHNLAPYPFEMELYNVSSNTFRTVANMRVGRGYHSIALLLPDGRIMIGGGGSCGGCQTNGDQNNIEFYKPPYLFKPNGNGGQTEVTDRPVITTISQNGTPVTIDTNLGYNQNFQMTTSGKTIARVTMIKLGAVTHARNFDQNFNQLNFNDNGSSLTVTTPNEPAWATPGHYMIFAIDTDGVPSVAKIIKLQ
jgi:hypothetical protein